MRKICKEANISIGGFYHHYSSKQDIVNTAFKLFDETLNESLVENYDNPLTAIKDILIKQTQFIVDEAGMLISIYYKNILDDENSFATNPNRVYYQRVLFYTQEAVDKGLLSLKFSYGEITAEYITEFLIKFVRGCIVDWCLHKCKYDIVKRLDFEIDVLFKGLCS